jgi:predicted nucleic acid-binding protein
MPGKNETVAWDTSIFLAWLNDEKRAAGEMEGVAQSLASIEAGEINLVAANLIRAEIRQARLTDDARQQLDGFLKRSNVEVASGSDPIMTLAGELCQFYDQQKLVDGLPPLCMPNAIHLATGIIYQVKAFYTFDGKGNPRCRGLIPLSGNVAGYKLTISRPPYTPPAPEQQNLFK